MNRLKTKSYSDGTPGVTYTYDTGAAKGIGRLTKVENANSATAYTEYDEMGRVKQSWQQTNGQTYGFVYTYNLAGALTSETYPSGRTVSTTYDGVNRSNSVTGSMNGQSKGYITQAAYWSHGAIYYYVRGNGVWYAASYNSRLQRTESYEAMNNSGAQLLFVSCPDWGSTSNPGVGDFCPHPAASANNGNLQRYTEYHGGPEYAQLLGFGQSFIYDGVNRLKHAEDTGGWSRDFNYDQYGNMWVTNAVGIAAPGQPLVYDPAKNQIQQAAGTLCQNSTLYDCAGNQLTVGGTTLTYDAENRQVKATNSSLIGPGTETYSYDGDGKRVQKSGPSGTTVYVYDAAGQLAAEYGTVAASPCQTCYLAVDHLGSTRLLLNENGQVVARHDFLPFGEEIEAGAASRNSQWGTGIDSVNQKFTGKERDQETGLDYFGARYYGSSLGRFTSPDWSEKPEAVPYADFENPQTLNLYTYGGNNPLSRMDPDGHKPCTVDGERHGSVWCFLHSINLAETKHEQANDLRKAYNGVVTYGSEGKPVLVSTMSDTDIIKYNQENRGQFAATGWHIGGLGLTPSKLQHIYDRHAGDFGVTGNKSSEQLQKLEQALEEHVTDADTRLVPGQYRGQDANIYVNSRTNNVVVTDKANNVITGFKASQAQLGYINSTGRLN